ncbi:MAG TPA: PEGA domain-containing protein, partial [bacterium]|nr:PEGA domain-containing protein [bacterium]
AYTLTVVSNPGGAEILVNGIPSGFQTPHVITSLEVGKKYLITVSKDGYLTNEQEIVNNDQGDKSIDITLSALPKASLVISSQPEGATIYLGGEKTAFETPHTVDALDIPQKILITLKKQGYEDAIEAVVLTAAKEYPVGLTLNKIPVIPTEKITTPHNTSQTETTSSSTTTSKTKDSFSAFNTTNSNLAQLGKLRIDSRPAGASVSINGTPKGITPMVVGDLPKNTALSVTVLKKGYSAWSRTVRLSQDRLEINAILAP